MGCEQGVFRSTRSPFAAALLLLVVVLLVDPGLGDRSSEEKRNKKLEAEKAALASGKISAQQSEEYTNGSVKVTEPDTAADEFIDTLQLLAKRRDELQKACTDLQHQVEEENLEKEGLEKHLARLQIDLNYMDSRKKVCVRRIERARNNLADMSTKYEELILWANQAITCLKGSCVEAEKTFLTKKNTMTPGKLENAVDTLMKEQNLNINAVEEGLTMPPQDGTGGTTKAGENQYNQESTQDNNFFKDGIEFNTKGPVESDAMAVSTTKGGNTGGSGDPFFDMESINNAQKQGQITNTQPEGEEENLSGTTAQGGQADNTNFFKNKEDIQNYQGGSTVQGTTLPTASDGFFSKDVDQQLQEAAKNGAYTGSKNFCEQPGSLDGTWFHGDETQIDKKQDKPEKLKENKVEFADGHTEVYECTFDPNTGTKITFTMSSASKTPFEGFVSNDGKVIKWNDGDYWHKSTAEES